MLWIGAVLVASQVMASDGLPTGTAATASASAAAIDTITIERGCFGCPDSGLLTLRRDGVATHTTAGSARQGITSKTEHGHVSAAAFDTLARLLVSQGFFALDDSYEDPKVRDGAWVTLGASGSGPAKQVFSREGAGPAALKRMVAALEAAKAQIRFTP